MVDDFEDISEIGFLDDSPERIEVEKMIEKKWFIRLFIWSGVILLYFPVVVDFLKEGGIIN